MATKTKWKCKSCQKSLASKQTALNHVKVFHKESDPHNTISKVIVQLIEDHIDILNPKKDTKVVKKKAFNHFSQLSNIFSDDNIVEKFSFSQPKKSKGAGDMIQPQKTIRVANSEVLPASTSVTPEPGPGTSSSSNPPQELHCSSIAAPLLPSTQELIQTQSCHVLPSLAPVPNVIYLTPEPQNVNNVLVSHDQVVSCDFPDFDLNSSEAFPGINYPDITADFEEETTFDLLFRVNRPKNVSAAKHFMVPSDQVTSVIQHVPPLCPPANPCQSSPAQNLTLPSSQNPSSEMVRTASPISSPSYTTTFPTPCLPESSDTLSSATIAPNQDQVPSRLSVPTLRRVTEKEKTAQSPLPNPFKTPYKTRGHCGYSDCQGCNREPCGFCYNCIHKKEIR